MSRQGMAERVWFRGAQHQRYDRHVERCESSANLPLALLTDFRTLISKVTRWVTETILSQDDLKKRANIVKHFILVAEVSCRSWSISSELKLTSLSPPTALLISQQFLHPHSYHRWTQLDAHPSPATDLGVGQSEVYDLTRHAQQHHATGQELQGVPRPAPKSRSSLRSFPW